MKLWIKTLQIRWQAVSAREQRWVLIALTVVALAVVWWLAMAPALATLKSAPEQHRTLDAQVQDMLGLQAQAKALQGAPTLDANAARRALEASLAILGEGAQLVPQGERVRVSFTAVPASVLAQWLSSTRQNAHVVPTEAKLQRSDAQIWGGSVVFTFAQP